MSITDIGSQPPQVDLQPSVGGTSEPSATESAPPVIEAQITTELASTEQQAPDVGVGQPKSEEVAPLIDTPDQAQSEAAPTPVKRVTIEEPPSRADEGVNGKGKSSGKIKKGKAAASKPPPKQVAPQVRSRPKPDKVEKPVAPTEKKPARLTTKEKKAAKSNKKKDKDAPVVTKEDKDTAIVAQTDEASTDTAAVVDPGTTEPVTGDATTEQVTSDPVTQTTADPVTPIVVTDPATESSKLEVRVAQDLVPETSEQETPVPEDPPSQEADSETIVTETFVSDVNVPQKSIPEASVPEATPIDTPVPKDATVEQSVLPETETGTPVPEGSTSEIHESQVVIPETSEPEIPGTEPSEPAASVIENATSEGSAKEVAVTEVAVPGETTAEAATPELAIQEDVLPEVAVQGVAVIEEAAKDVIAQETSTLESSAVELEVSQEATIAAPISKESVPDTTESEKLESEDQTLLAAATELPTPESIAVNSVADILAPHDIITEAELIGDKLEGTGEALNTEAIVDETISDVAKITESADSTTETVVADSQLPLALEAKEDSAPESHEVVDKDIGQEAETSESAPQISLVEPSKDNPLVLGSESKVEIADETETTVEKSETAEETPSAVDTIGISETTAANDPPSNPESESTSVDDIGKTDTVEDAPPESLDERETAVKEVEATKGDDFKNEANPAAVAESMKNENPKTEDPGEAEGDVVAVALEVVQVLLTGGVAIVPEQQETQAESEPIATNSIADEIQQTIEKKDSDTINDINSDPVSKEDIESVKIQADVIESQGDGSPPIMIEQQSAPVDSTSATEESTKAETKDSKVNELTDKALDQPSLSPEAMETSPDEPKLESTLPEYEMTPKEAMEIVDAELTKDEPLIVPVIEIVESKDITESEAKDEPKVETQIVDKANDIGQDQGVAAISDEHVSKEVEAAPEIIPLEADVIIEVLPAVVIVYQEIQKSDTDKVNTGNDGDEKRDSAAEKIIEKTDVAGLESNEASSQSTVIAEDSNASTAHEDSANKTTVPVELSVIPQEAEEPEHQASEKAPEESNMDNRSIAAVCDDEADEVIEDNIQPSLVTKIDDMQRLDIQEMANTNEPPLPITEPIPTAAGNEPDPAVDVTADLNNANGTAEVIKISRTIVKEQERKHRKHRNSIIAEPASISSNSSRMLRDGTGESGERNRVALGSRRQTTDSRTSRKIEDSGQRNSRTSGARDVAGEVIRSSRHHKYDSGVYVPDVEVTKRSIKKESSDRSSIPQEQPRMRRSRTDRSEKVIQPLPSSQEPERPRRFSNTFASVGRTLRPKLFDGIRAESEAGLFVSAKAQQDTPPTIRRSRTEARIPTTRSDNKNDRSIEEAERRKAHDRRKEQAAKDLANAEAERRRARHEARRMERDRAESEEADRARRKRREERKKRDIAVVNEANNEDAAIISDERPDGTADVLEEMKPKEIKEKIERHRHRRSERPSMSHSNASDKDKDRDIQKIQRRLSHASGEGSKRSKDGSLKEKSAKARPAKESRGFLKRILGI